LQKVSEWTIHRLSTYHRLLSEFESEGREYISSHELAHRAGATPAQVRRDLSCFGTFGTKGRGYFVADLSSMITSILGIDRDWRVALVGAGRLGSALFSYKEFRRRNFHIVAVFDSDKSKIGKHWADVEIEHPDALKAVVSKHQVDIGVIAVPSDTAQSVANAMVDAGIKAILNFAHRKLFVPDGVALRNVNMAMELEALSYAMSRNRRLR
jgi:redox-sensing transcriptional repressor